MEGLLPPGEGGQGPDEGCLNIKGSTDVNLRTSRHRIIAAALAAVFLSNVTGALVLGQGNSVTSAGRTTSEYEVKAAYLLNFARFVEWPAPPPGQANDPFSICIVGDDPFQGALDRLVEGEAIAGRPIIVRRLPRWQEPCMILFVSRSERDAFRILRQAGRGVLTVGEEPGFLSDGGMINFVVDDRKVKFDVNLKAATESSIRINSRLLSVAKSIMR
jgi:hypothetical protein